MGKPAIKTDRPTSPRPLGSAPCSSGPFSLLNHQVSPPFPSLTPALPLLSDHTSRLLPDSTLFSGLPDHTSFNPAPRGPRLFFSLTTTPPPHPIPFSFPLFPLCAPYRLSPLTPFSHLTLLVLKYPSPPMVPLFHL